MSASCFIVIPTHNRRDTTLACLQRLRAQGVMDWAVPIIVDDGSTDGTPEAVRAQFPEVEMVIGNGRLFWTGATELGMRSAVARNAEFVLWLNDDCEPEPGALAELLSVAMTRDAITGGVCVLPKSGEPVYAGFKKGRRELEFISAAPGEVVACDGLNGNLVCVPRAVINAIGFPSGGVLPHASGDTDYTMRASERGRTVLLVGSARARAVPHNRFGYASWLLSGMNAAEIWATLFNRRAYGYLPADFRFRWRHWGIGGVFTALWMVLKRVPISLAVLAVPLATRRRWWGHNSSAWNYERSVRAESGHE